jgi:hypothetical protein
MRSLIVLPGLFALENIFFLEKKDKKVLKGERGKAGIYL